MNHPTPVIPFEQRLNMAQATIDTLLQRAKPAHRQCLLNSLWARWINQNILGKKPALRAVQGGDV